MKKGSKSGKRADLGDQYFRSAWEANYARWLNMCVSNGFIERWTYEEKEYEFPVKRGNRFYKPDFFVYLPSGAREIHEVKGFMDADSKTKLKRFAKYYPQEKLILVTGEWFKAANPNLKRLIPHWE